jgi:hypothetical protein
MLSLVDHRCGTQPRRGSGCLPFGRLPLALARPSGAARIASPRRNPAGLTSRRMGLVVQPVPGARRALSEIQEIVHAVPSTSAEWQARPRTWLTKLLNFRKHGGRTVGRRQGAQRERQAGAQRGRGSQERERPQCGEDGCVLGGATPIRAPHRRGRGRERGHPAVCGMASFVQKRTASGRPLLRGHRSTRPQPLRGLRRAPAPARCW